MKKKSKKVAKPSPKPSTHSSEELDEMAWSLVNRGLAPLCILDRNFTKPPHSRGSRLGNYPARERNKK